MRRPSRLRRLAVWAAVTGAALALGAFLFAASGIYNVAAGRGHFHVTALFLEFAMRRSVATHSLFITEPDLGDPDLIRLGAGHFHGGCAPCHGAPGEPRNPIALGMLPPPPDLAESVAPWSTPELFWIVKNGLKYTGMPAWPAQQRDDEVWAVIAFLRQLPTMGEAAYRTLALGNAEPLQRSARELVRLGSRGDAISTCARCHDDESAPTTSRFTPILAGQPARFITEALRSYASGSRPSGIMQPIAARLDPEAVAAVADYYADLARAPARPPSPELTEAIARGRTIATAGAPRLGIPPCLACHAGAAAATFPRLAGQHAPYLARQLHLFRDGVRRGTPQADIMAVIARRLSDEQIADVAAYFAHLAPDAPTAARDDASAGKASP
jgi:cytochrome c553